MKKVFSTVLICILLLGCFLSLASCYQPNSDAEKAEAKLKDKGYVVVSIPTPGIAGINRSFSATRYDKSHKRVDWVQIFYISENADEVYEYVQKFLEKEQNAEDNQDRKIEYGKKADVVWFGTVNAVADFQ